MDSPVTLSPAEALSNALLSGKTSWRIYLETGATRIDSDGRAYDRLGRRVRAADRRAT